MAPREPQPALRRTRERLQQRSEELSADRDHQVDLLACDRCGGDMVVRSSNISAEPCRDDARVKCPWDTGCGWWTTHGIAISRATYEDEMAARPPGGHVDGVTTETQETTVAERLDALGYVEM